jgi:hypothetical protein
MGERDNPAMTQEEWRLACEMAGVMWGVNLYGVYWMRCSGRPAALTVPVAYMPDRTWLDWAESSLGFAAERIAIDRWLIPWRIKAGYSPALNAVAYWEAEEAL